MCPITLILFMSSSVDPPSWWCIPKTVIVLHLLFNNTHWINLCILITSLNKTCVLVSHQLYICISKTSRNERSKRCSKTSRNAEKVRQFTLQAYCGSFHHVTNVISKKNEPRDKLVSPTKKGMTLSHGWICTYLIFRMVFLFYGI
jgi:hypothetical protein